MFLIATMLHKALIMPMVYLLVSILIVVALGAKDASAMAGDGCPNKPFTPRGVVSLNITSAWIVQNVWYGRPQSQVWTAVANTGNAYACMFAVWASRVSDVTSGLYVGFSAGLPAGAELISYSDPLPASLTGDRSCLNLQLTLMPHPPHTLSGGPPRSLCRSSAGKLEWTTSLRPVQDGSRRMRLHVKVKNTGALGTPRLFVHVTSQEAPGLQEIGIPALSPDQQDQQEIVVNLRDADAVSPCLRLENAVPMYDSESSASIELSGAFGELHLNLPVTACANGN